MILWQYQSWKSTASHERKLSYLALQKNQLCISILTVKFRNHLATIEQVNIWNIEAQKTSEFCCADQKIYRNILLRNTKLQCSYLLFIIIYPILCILNNCRTCWHLSNMRCSLRSKLSLLLWTCIFIRCT